MVAGDGVMQCLPQALDDIDPRAIGRLEHKLEFRIPSEPALRDLAFVNGVVIDDEHDTSGTPVNAFDLVEQMDEQQGVLSLMLDAHDASALCVQRTGKVILAVLPGCRHRMLVRARHPARANAWIEVDIGFVGIEDLGVGVGFTFGQGPIHRPQARAPARVADVQRRACPAPGKGQARQPAPNAGRVHGHANAFAEHQGQQLGAPARANITVLLWRALDQIIELAQHLIVRFPVRATARLWRQALRTELLEQRALALHRRTRRAQPAGYFRHAATGLPQLQNGQRPAGVVLVRRLVHDSFQLSSRITGNLNYTMWHRVASLVMGRISQPFRSLNATRVPLGDRYFQSAI